MNRVVFTGARGELYWGYQTAALVTAWRLEGPTLTGRVEAVHGYRISQHPITFVVRHAQGEWTWPLQELQIAGDELTAVVAPEETHGTDPATGNGQTPH